MALEIIHAASPLPAGTGACIGAFDGLHLGHRALLERAAAHGDHTAVITFNPHPARVLAPSRAPALLQKPVQRERVLDSMGVDTLVLLPFDEKMATTSPHDFVRVHLIDGLRPSALVVGEDFRFGAGRAGDARTLARLLPEAGIELEIVPAVTLPGAGGKLSSTDIRVAIARGEVEQAAQLLGRAHAVSGRVVGGAKRGRKIGFPTANVDHDGGFLPAIGIYATFLAVWDRDSPDYGRVWPAATSIGRNPTFAEDDAPVVLEAYAIDEDLGERLYGVDVEVSFVARIRSEERFDGADALVAQINRDVERARALLTADARNGVINPPAP